MYHCGEKTELHTGQAVFVNGGSKKTPIFGNVEACNNAVYIILQYNHWQQISSTTNILNPASTDPHVESLVTSSRSEVVEFALNQLQVQHPRDVYR